MAAQAIGLIVLSRLEAMLWVTSLGYTAFSRDVTAAVLVSY